QPEVHANALGVPDVQIAVGLGREPRADAGRVGRAPGLDRGRARLAGPALALESVGLQIVVDDVAQEIGGGSRRGGGGHARERRKQRQSVNFATSALRNRCKPVPIFRKQALHYRPSWISSLYCWPASSSRQA